MIIGYKTLHGVAERIKMKSDESDVLTITFEPECDGVVCLGPKRFAVTRGVSRIPYSSIPDGEYQPTLEADTGFCSVEGFAKYGSEICALKTDEETVRRLVLRSHRLVDRCTQLEQRIKDLEQACLGHTIFNFERKEK